jgi:hypothetical protein
MFSDSESTDAPFLCFPHIIKTLIMPTARKKSSEKDPCWDGYKQVGEKKSGKEVPNYVSGKKKEIAGSRYWGCCLLYVCFANG